MNCWDCIDLKNKPNELSSSYQIDFINSRFISLTIHTDHYAGGGANGVAHNSTPLTFDFKRNRLIRLKDIIRRGYDSIIYKVILDQLRQSNQNLITSFDNEQGLENITSILIHPISVNQKGITIYWTLSYGHGMVDAEINLEFANNDKVFEKKFIENVRSK